MMILSSAVKTILLCLFPDDFWAAMFDLLVVLDFVNKFAMQCHLYRKAMQELLSSGIKSKGLTASMAWLGLQSPCVVNNEETERQFYKHGIFHTFCKHGHISKTTIALSMKLSGKVRNKL